MELVLQRQKKRFKEQFWASQDSRMIHHYSPRQNTEMSVAKYVVELKVWASFTKLPGVLGPSEELTQESNYSSQMGRKCPRVIRNFGLSWAAPNLVNLSFVQFHSGVPNIDLK